MASPSIHSSISKQNGQVFLITVVLLAVGVAGLVYYMSNPSAEALKQSGQTALAFAQAKEALIGYAASDSSKPGSLPCPDTNDDGNGESASPNCPSYIGRLPWKTLSLPNPLEGNGERLWYALSPNYRDLAPPTGPILNPETAGQLTVNGASGVIAVLIAPGSVVASQVRDGTNALVASNYLEGGNENGGTTYTFISGTTNTRNDKLLAITRDQLMPPVELRVARELRNNLRTYYSTYGYYPLATTLTGTGECIEGQFQGRLATSSCLLPSSASSGQVTIQPVTVPTWFSANEWYKTLMYAAAPRCTPRVVTTTSTSWSWSVINLGGVCTYISFIGLFLCPTTTTSHSIDTASNNCNNTAAGSPAGSWLTVDSTSNVQSILMPSGYGIGSQVRSCTTLANCLEDAANSDGNYIFTRPQKSTTNNDNLVVVGP